MPFTDNDVTLSETKSLILIHSWLNFYEAKKNKLGYFIMSIEIISTGNEIMSGLTLDTNFNWAAGMLASKGMGVKYHTSIPDDLEDLISSFRIAASRAKAVIITGGLGPTDDDLSALAAAKFTSSELVFSQIVFDSITQKLEQRGRKPNQNHKKQAMFPDIAKIIENNIGTAWGFKFEYKGTSFYFLPGVPGEFRAMFIADVLPELKSKIEKDKYVSTRLLKTFGLGESEVASLLKNLECEGVDIGYRLKFPEVHLRLVTYCDNEKEIKYRFDNAISLLTEKLGTGLFSTDEKTLEEVTAELLVQKKLTLSTAESCTGGLVASLFTDIPGSSMFFERGVVTYSNEAKIELLGVKKKDLDDSGAVSAPVAEQMAEGVRKISATHIGIGISGIAGPGGGSPEKPVGTVYIGLSASDGTLFSNKYSFQGSRKDIKLISASTAIDLVRKFCANAV